MALQSKRERILLAAVLLAGLAFGGIMAGRQVNQIFAEIDESIEQNIGDLNKKREIYSDLEGIEERFARVGQDLSIPGEIDQQKAIVAQQLIDLIGASGIEYGSVKLDETVDQMEEDFFLVRLTIDDIRAGRETLAKFLYLVDDVATMEVEQLSMRGSNRYRDSTLRATVRVSRLIPTKEFMRGLEES